ncbi:hypothetical protein MFUL124B02_40885 [Myxococcus fulvus 124B02]|nr:hypothetical protein MFUL124B02_40885 [Myxococcus fulvus 124B02]
MGAQAHTLGTPPVPQAWPLEQVPQSSEPPQPLEMTPQFLPCATHVVGSQHTWATFTAHASPSTPEEPSSMAPSQSSSRPLQVSAVPEAPSAMPS